MRPEKHQKIRRHQKNKHGKGGHGSSSSSKQKSVDSTGKNATKSQPSKHPEGSQLPRPNSDELRSSSNEARTTASASNDSWKSGSQEERRSFSRRKIESNWSRYGDIENLDDENVGLNQRGADISLLLSKEDDSSSQFRFRDELDWQDDVYLQEEDTTSVLSLNVESLASQIQCLPISQRLNIDEKIFSMFEEDFGISNISSSRGTLQNTEIKNDKYSEPLMPSVSVEDIAKKDPVDTKLNVNFSTKEQLKGTFKPYLQTERKSATSSTEITFSKQLDAAKTSLNRTNPVDSFNQATSNLKAQEKTENDDDELDFLLALDNPTKVKQLSNTQQECPDDQEIKTELDIQKETNLTTSNTKQTGKYTVDLGSNEKTDESNLEDWLDSILED